MTRYDLQQPADKRPTPFVVFQMMGQEPSRLAGIGTALATRPQMPRQYPKRSRHADKITAAPPINDIDMGIDLNQFVVRAGRAAAAEGG